MNERIARNRTVEFGMAFLLLALLGVISLPIVDRAREGARRRSCQSNLKELGIVFKMYSGENKGDWPPLSPVPDNWIPDVDAIYPVYLTNVNTLICPASSLASQDTFTSRFGGRGVPSPDCVSSLFYTYTGYLIWCDEQALALFDGRRDWLSLLTLRTLEVDTPLWKDSDRASSVNQGATPVLWDRVPLSDDEFSHSRGVNVLHMDGHVEFVRYSADNNSNYFPATRTAGETFGSVLPQMPAHCYAN